MYSPVVRPETSGCGCRESSTAAAFPLAVASPLRTDVAAASAACGSPASAGVTGRVFEVEGGIVGIAEGYRHGPRVDKGARWEPEELTEVVGALLDEAAEPTPVYGAG